MWRNRVSEKRSKDRNQIEAESKCKIIHARLYKFTRGHNRTVRDLERNVSEAINDGWRVASSTVYPTRWGAVNALVTMVRDDG